MLRFVLASIVLVLCASVVAAQETTTEPADPVGTAEALVERAQTLVERASSVQEENVGTVNFIIDVVGVFLVILGALTTLLVAIAGILGFRSFRQLNDQKDQLQQEVAALKALQTELQAEKDILAQDQQLLDEKLELVDALPGTINDTMDAQQSLTKNETEALALVQFAVRQIDVGNRRAAMRTLERALALSPDNSVANFLLGEVKVRQGHYQEGLVYLLQAQGDDALPDAQASLAYAYRMLGDKNEADREEFYADAIKIYQRLKKQNPDLLDISGDSVYGALGGLYRNQGRIALALQVYEDVAERTPSSPYPFNNLGLLHFEYSDQAFASREKGRHYFEQSRRKARFQMSAESADYWRLFDLITAEVALEEIGLSALHDLVDEMLDYKPIPDDLAKLRAGLEQLQHATPPPQHVDALLAYLAQKV